MTVFLRCDAGGGFGLGHAMRCRTLAQAIHAQSPEMPLVFVTTTPALRSCIDKIDGEGWRLVVCSDEWEAFEAVRAQAQSEDVLLFDMPRGMEWVAGRRQLRLLQTVRVVRIDAPWAKPDSCDLLILPGMHHSAETIDRLDAAFGDRLLVGAEYMLLQDDLLEYRRHWHDRDAGIAWYAGGSDPECALPQFYIMTRQLHAMLGYAETFLYLVGPLSKPWKLDPPSHHDFITGFSPMALAQSGLFVSLWGTTVYEAMALGTPTLTIARTEDEAEDACRLEAATDGAVQSLGTLAGLMRETLCDRLVALWEDTKERKRMYYASEGLLNGKGAERVARAVLGLRI